jgi:hypothetical protein
MKEPLPLATIHEAVLEFLRNRNDAALFRAQAVNAYVDEPRMTQDVDVLSTRASELAEELRAHLAATFTIAARVRAVADGKGFRVYQLRQPKNRDLVDVRHVAELPPTQLVAEVRVLTPDELIAQKVMAYTRRQGQPKRGTDLRDLLLLLLAFPDLKSPGGAVSERLAAYQADEETFKIWRHFATAPIEADPDDLEA